LLTCRCASAQPNTRRRHADHADQPSAARLNRCPSTVGVGRDRTIGRRISWE
jgi:hypothetical protein